MSIFNIADFLEIDDAPEGLAHRIPEDNLTQARRADVEYSTIDQWHEDSMNTMLVAVSHGVQYAINPGSPSQYRMNETQEVPDNHIFTSPDGVITHHGPYPLHRRNPLAVSDKRMSLFSGVARHPMLMPHHGAQLRVGMTSS